MSAKRSRWLRWLVLAGAGYASLLGLLMIFEEKLLFFPARYPRGDWDPPRLEFEDAWFHADDGSKLHGWFVPHRSPRAHVLIAHGNGGNLAGRATLLRALHGLGAASMIFDYRGYGRSEGAPTAAGILADGRAARRWLADRAGLPPDRIVLFGESLGGAVAVHLAAEGGARALVLENTFNSLADVAAHHYPWAPVRLLLRSKLESADWIRNYRGPLLQFHGDADQTVPYEFGRRLFEAANDPKELVTIRGGGHSHMNDGLVEELGRLLERLGPAEAR
jgi:fermentation-respiration switch protein FrsA (DUF1100 family)